MTPILRERLHSASLPSSRRCLWPGRPARRSAWRLRRLQQRLRPGPREALTSVALGRAPDFALNRTGRLPPLRRRAQRKPGLNKQARARSGLSARGGGWSGFAGPGPVREQARARSGPWPAEAGGPALPGRDPSGSKPERAAGFQPAEAGGPALPGRDSLIGRAQVQLRQHAGYMTPILRERLHSASLPSSRRCLWPGRPARRSAWRFRRLQQRLRPGPREASTWSPLVGPRISP